MREIRRMVGSDLENIKLIYEKAFERSEGVLEYYQGFPEYVEFCIKQRYAYVAVDEDTVCGVCICDT